MRTILSPDLYPNHTLEVLQSWSAAYWSPNLEVSSFDEDFIFPDTVHIASDGSASRLSGGFAWYEKFSGSWFAAGSRSSDYFWRCSSAQYAEAHSVLHIFQNIGSTSNVNLYLDCRNVVDAFNRILNDETVKTSSSRVEWLQELYAAKRLAEGRNVNVVWVKSHSSHLENRIADVLANWARKEASLGNRVSTIKIHEYVEKLKHNASYRAAS